jgi:primosomal protein N' (replication factor Y)
MYAEIALNTPVHRTFTYAVPPGLTVTPGHLVRVPFRTAMAAGIVMALTDSTDIAQTKPIDALIDPTPVIGVEQIALARWMSESAFAPIGLCAWLWVPSGLDGYRDTLVTLTDEPPEPENALEDQLFRLLQRRGPLRLRQIKASIRDGQLDRLIAALVRSGTLTTRSVLTPPRVRPQTVQTAALAVHPRQIDEVIPLLGRKSRRADALEAVAKLTVRVPWTPVKDVLRLAGTSRDTLRKLASEENLVQIDGDRVRLALPADAVPGQLIALRKAETDVHVLRVLARESEPLDVSWLYAQTGAKLADLKRLADLELVTLSEKVTWRDSLANRDFVPGIAPQLTAEQQRAWRPIYEAIHGDVGGAFLLHGVTGSGKTELYLRAIEETLGRGQQAVLLVPEIALTAQTVRRVAARFRGRIAVYHSGLSEGERYDAWRRAREGLADVIVGARSALFLPLPNPGLIVLDEEHDPSYKNFAAPAYDTRVVAEMMMRRRGGVLIMGSATPDMATFYRAHQGEIRYLHLPNRIMGHRTRIGEQAEREGVTARYHDAGADALMIDLPPVEIVDMRDELKRGNTSIFSAALRDSLGQVLANREQAILFLNRRGTATYVFCRDCGYIARCEKCDTPLTHHGYDDRLKCHHCGHEQATPQTCPQCRSRRIRFFGAGTQHIEDTLKHEFPQARTVRWDADTASQPEMHDAILSRFLDREADIMVGTQMIAKGLDLPLVTLVGVVSADTALGLPDFRAMERTFQLLTQVAGRAGRGVLGGKVILQTYHPDNYAIQAAASHDYAGFYVRELEYRREMGYPPFRRLAKILFQDKSLARAREDAHNAARLLTETIAALDLSGTELIGPVPCFFGRVNEIYRWQVIIRSPDPLVLLNAVEAAQRWHVEVDPLDTL